MWKILLLVGCIRTTSPKGGALLPHRCCCSTARLPPSCSRRPLGFAPPPRDGFALLAAHTRMRLHAHIITNGRTIRNGFESAGGSFLRFLLFSEPYLRIGSEL